MIFLAILVAAMPDAKSHSEPSMQEIIASISRVIAQDIQPGDRRAGEVQPSGKIPPAPREGGDVLELTQVVNEDGSISRVTPRIAAEAARPAEPALASASPAATGRIEPTLHAAHQSRLNPGKERL